MSTIDTNINNYTISELLTIANIQNLDETEIITNTNKLSNKFKKSNPQLSVFFQEIQSQLLQYSGNLTNNESFLIKNEQNEDDEDDAQYEQDEQEYEADHPDESEQKSFFNLAQNLFQKTDKEGFGNMSNEAKLPSAEKQTNDWIENENLEQNNSTQTQKITDRKQKIDTFGNQHVPMKQQQLGINDTYQVPVKQDSLNPNLKNIISRFINLDSQFRQYSSDNSSTDYTLDLSDTLKNVLSLSLYSFQIPYSWYTIDIPYGNTCLWITEIIDGITYNIPISVLPGNYTSIQFQTVLTTAFTNSNSGFSNFPIQPSPITSPIYYNSNNGKITLFLDGTTFLDPSGIIPSFVISPSTLITFFDFTGILQCNRNCANKANYLNQSLGWIMGFRVPYVNVDPSGNIASSVVDLNGTKYLILVVDDFNQNHVNDSLVTELSNTLKMPSYYSTDIPHTCLSPAQQPSNLQSLINDSTIKSILDGQGNTNINGLLISSKYNSEYSNTQLVLPSAPRTLTQSQIYTINEINKNRNNNTKYRAKAPTSSNILAMIPIKIIGLSTGALLVDFAGSLQDHKRTYFGPVNIEKMAVKLLDDKGNVLNLNGVDWCVTLLCECLYQY